MPDLNKPRQEGVRPVSGTVAERSQFEGELFRDVIPLVEKTYRVATGARNRAVAGLSVGGYYYWVIKIRTILTLGERAYLEDGNASSNQEADRE